MHYDYGALREFLPFLHLTFFSQILFSKLIKSIYLNKLTNKLWSEMIGLHLKIIIKRNDNMIDY